jgi:inhibitor of cysteine peptidase
MKKILKITAMLLAIAALVFAAGCSEKTEIAENETQEDSEQMAPAATEASNMTGENVTEANTTQANETSETGQTVTEADNGTSISLKNGETFTLQLRENPSTGYSWEINVSEGLSILSDGYIQDEAPESDNGEVAVGVPGTHSWIIEAVTPGSQQVNGIYKRSWENTTGTEENFTLAVEVE